MHLELNSNKLNQIQIQLSLGSIEMNQKKTSFRFGPMLMFF
jgi:hypothetical protein